jgi:hypothetical protein
MFCKGFQSPKDPGPRGFENLYKTFKNLSKTFETI